MAEEGLPKTADLLHGMVNNMERGEKAAKGMEFSISRMATSMLTASGFAAVLKQLVGQSETMLKIKTALSNENLRALGISELQVGVISTTVAAMSDLLVKQHQFNQNLIEANSTFEHRNKLISDTLVLQTQTGISFDKITDSARALVHYGMDTEATFETNLELVAKLEQGLGVSASESARLATIVERQLKGSFEGVSDTIAQIVENTALAGDEATRLATSISTAMGRLGPGMSAAGLPEVLKLVGRYEGALKEIGGSSGALTQLLTQMTTPEGIMGAGALGITPDFLATADGVEEVMTRFANYGEMIVGKSNGWERQLRLQLLAQQFNMSADSANQLMLMVQRAREQQEGVISTNDRWRQQMHAANEGIIRLSNSIWGLLQTGLLPFVNIISGITNYLADIVEYVLKSKTTLYTLAYTFATVAVVASLALTRVAWALVKVTAASLAASVSLAQNALIQNAARAGGMVGPINMAGAGGIRGMFSLLTGGMKLSFLGPLLVALSPLLVIAGFLYAIHKTTQDSLAEQKAAQKLIFTREKALEDQNSANFYSASRYGTPDEQRAAFAKALRQGASMFDSETNPVERERKTREWQKSKTDELLLSAFTSLVTRVQFTPLSERTDEQLTAEVKTRELAAEGVAINKQQLKLMQEDAMRKLRNEGDEIEALKHYTRENVGTYMYEYIMGKPKTEN